jgi:hypothetical protein
MAFLTVIAICCFTVVLRQHQIKIDAKVDTEATTPNDFAIMVRGTACTEERTIQEWFKNNVLRDPVEVVKVVIGWDFHDVQNRMNDIKVLRESKNGLDLSDPTQRQQIIAINAQIK